MPPTLPLIFSNCCAMQNTKEEDISFILMDQLPLSNDVKIQV